MKVLNDICDLIIDCEHKTAPTQDEGYPSIRTPNIGKGYFILDGVNRVSEETYQAWTRRAIPSPGDLIMAREAPVGNVAIIPEGLNPCLGQRTLLIRPNKELVEPMYLNYLLIGPEVQNRIHSQTNGATVAHLNMKDVRNLKLPTLPSKDTQKKIAAILSAYDDLIENNTRRIAILEEMARLIYREWFVHFRYPGHEKVKLVDSPLGKIPQGWEVKTVQDMVERIPSGKKYDNKTISKEGKIPVLDQGKSGIIGYHNDNPSVIASEENPVIVFANHTCYQRLIQFPFSAIQNVLPFVPSRDKFRNIYWLHYATKDIISFNDYKGHWPEFMKKEIIVPTLAISNMFGEIVSNGVKLTLNLERQVDNLRQTRDLLLPRLISGEIDVSEMEVEGI